MALDYTPVDWTGSDTASDAPEEVRLRIAIEDALLGGAVPFSVYPYTGQPTAAQTVTIGADVYEFVTAGGSVANDAHIAVVIGASSDATHTNLVAAINATTFANQHPTLTQTDTETPALANGTEDVFALVDTTGDKLYIFAADAPGGNLVPGSAPSLVLTDTASNGGPWKFLNLNLSLGGAAARAGSGRAAFKHVVVAGDLSAAQPLLIPLGFLPITWQVAVYLSGGRQVANPDIKIAAGSAIGGQNFLSVTLNGDGSGDALAATNVIHFDVAG